MCEGRGGDVKEVLRNGSAMMTGLAVFFFLSLFSSHDAMRCDAMCGMPTGELCLLTLALALEIHCSPSLSFPLSVATSCQLPVYQPVCQVKCRLYCTYLSLPLSLYLTHESYEG